MLESVIIVHPSEIFRKGLASILEPEISARITCLPEMGKLHAPDNLLHKKLALFLPYSLDIKKELPLINNKTSELFLAAIHCLDKTPPGNKLPFDKIYSWYTSPRAIIDDVKAFLQSGNQPPNDDELTLREKEVLKLIALGHTNKTIADTLFISTHTVISHRKNITEKLGIKSIPGLTIYAILQKIISQSDISKEKLL